ncbi:hypothetical protein QS795_002690 [Providencia zhijiangensis]|uniref:Uncharacterized protein n=1 Tax=Providencia zhijiangensis TaxID=3053982 RepID=A0ABZ0N302_9GAMM|nr:hypothetical protein [Providencia sp. D4759]WPA92704.1 hypothetical protein QS795_002690 [Providencia sp. D4759]
MRTFQTKSQAAALIDRSLNDMVIAITKNPKVFEGKSEIIIDKIKAAKNNGGDGWTEINNAWGIVASGKAKEKIDKYFKKGLRDVSSSENEYLKVSVKSEPKSESLSDKPIKTSSSDEKKTKPHRMMEKIESRLTQFKSDVKSEIKSKLDLIKIKETHKSEESLEVKNTYYSSFEELMDNLKSGASLSEHDLSYIKVLMSYIRTKKSIDGKDQVRTEMENFFMGIIGALHYDSDKKTVLNLFQEQRFLSIYKSYYRTMSYSILSLLEKHHFPKEITAEIKKHIMTYSNENLDKLQSDKVNYMASIRNIKEIKSTSGFDAFNSIDSVKKITLIKKILSDNEFTDEKGERLTTLSHDVKDGRIIEFIKEKMNLDIESLQSECDAKHAEEKSVYDKYIKEKNEIIDTGVNRIQSMLVMKSIRKSIVDSVIDIIQKKRNSTKIDVFSSKIDLIINMLQCKRIKRNKITNDIEHYLNMPMDKLLSEIEIAKSKKSSFKERVFSLFNGFNNRVLNFIYNVRHSFK